MKFKGTSMEDYGFNVGVQQYYFGICEYDISMLKIMLIMFRFWDLVSCLFLYQTIFVLPNQAHLTIDRQHFYYLWWFECACLDESAMTSSYMQS